MTTLRAIPMALALCLGVPTVTGCVGSAEMHTGAVVTTTTPRLIWVAPGVWVLEDYDYPVFWYGDYYWMLRDGVWYRSDYYTGNFVRVTVVPHVVLDVRTPRRYIHYRAPHNARVRVIKPRSTPAVRDHRSKRKPATRDHRRRH